MSVTSQLLIAFVAIEHLLFLYVEMFAWETTGKKIFRAIPREMFKPTKAMAANQGLYNGFLAAGLIWSVIISDEQWAFNVGCFFLICVIIASKYGAYSVSKTIFLVQGIPAYIALAALLILR